MSDLEKFKAAFKVNNPSPPDEMFLEVSAILLPEKARAKRRYRPDLDQQVKGRLRFETAEWKRKAE